MKIVCVDDDNNVICEFEGTPPNRESSWIEFNKVEFQVVETTIVIDGNVEPWCRVLLINPWAR